MNIEVFLQIFLWFKFYTSVQICIYLPTFVLIHTLCNRCCPTERCIRTVRIPGDLWYKYALSTNLPCVSRRSQFLVLLCIFPELISLQESCRSRFRLSSRLFLLFLIFRHILEIINYHPSLVVKVAKSFCKNTKYWQKAI